LNSADYNERKCDFLFHPPSHKQLKKESSGANTKKKENHAYKQLYVRILSAPSESGQPIVEERVL